MVCPAIFYQRPSSQAGSGDSTSRIMVDMGQGIMAGLGGCRLIINRPSARCMVTGRASVRGLCCAGQAAPVRSDGGCRRCTWREGGQADGSHRHADHCTAGTEHPHSVPGAGFASCLSPGRSALALRAADIRLRGCTELTGIVGNDVFGSRPFDGREIFGEDLTLIIQAHGGPGLEGGVFA